MQLLLLFVFAAVLRTLLIHIVLSDSPKMNYCHVAFQRIRMCINNSVNAFIRHYWDQINNLCINWGQYSRDPRAAGRASSPRRSSPRKAVARKWRSRGWRNSPYWTIGESRGQSLLKPSTTSCEQRKFSFLASLMSIQQLLLENASRRNIRLGDSQD
jgi:hypothetical protein